MKSDIVDLIYYFFEKTGIKVTRGSIEHELLTHPTYPSMQALSDSFDKWNIKHFVLRSTLGTLEKMDVPVIAHLSSDEFILISKVSDSYVYIRKSGRNLKMRRAEFENQWSGIALVFEDIEQAEEDDYHSKHGKELSKNVVKYGILAILILCWLSTAILSLNCNSQQASILLFTLILINLIGIGLSTILSNKDKFSSYKITKLICNAGKHLNCAEVASSRFSKLLGLISWADLGLAYFATNIIWLTLGAHNLKWIFIYSCFAMISLPFVIWSLFSQAVLIRKWCTLCCLVLSVLIANALIVWKYLTLDVVPELFILVIIFLCVLIFKLKIDEAALSKSQLYYVAREKAKLKYNNIVMSSLSKPVSKWKASGMVWGNPASDCLSLFVGINCRFCGEAIQQLNKLIDCCPSLNYQLVFATYNNADQQTKEIVRYFINAYKQYTKISFFSLLHYWYSMVDKNLHNIQQLYPINEYGIANMEDENNYFLDLNIDFTPAILINGNVMPSYYTYPELFSIAQSLQSK